MTRHELKELEHDQFAVKVGSAVQYTKTHRPQVLKWAIIGLVAILAIAGVFWFVSYKRAERQADLRAAYEVAEASIGDKASPFVKSYPTTEAKDQAVLKAMGDLASKHSGTDEGYIGEYYVGTVKAARGDYAAAISNFKDVANSSAAVSAYAKLALAQVYMGQGNRQEAEALLRGLMAKPNGLVSKEQATVLLAQLLAKQDPAASKKLLDSIDYQKMLRERAAVARAMDEARTGGPAK